MMQGDGSPASFFGVLGSKSCYTGANSVIRMKHENRPHASMLPSPTLTNWNIFPHLKIGFLLGYT
jgi:hypothetical protein